MAQLYATGGDVPDPNKTGKLAPAPSKGKGKKKPAPEKFDPKAKGKKK